MRYLAFLFVLFFIKSYSCDCDYSIDLPVFEMGLSLDNLSGRTDYIVFHGIVLDMKRAEERRYQYGPKVEKEYKVEITFEITKAFQGVFFSDTVLIRTNHGSDACAFGVEIGDECLIFGRRDSHGFYRTLRGDCTHSVAKNHDPKRYERYMRFVEVVTYKPDGDYVFMQTASYYNRSGMSLDEGDTIKALEFSINDGEFNGPWTLYYRTGTIAETGKYKNGMRVGIWTFNTNLSDTDFYFTKKHMVFPETIKKFYFSKGVLHRIKMTRKKTKMKLSTP